ncbi:MAG: NAD-dependent succinate-semialdehyde dehydrogenase [Armatimonadota bacterium]|nr:NAD-dependent succinate-semialdehyde dehydrogenase [Armatimonadota bacterium]
MTSRRGHSHLKSTDPSTGQVLAEYPLLEPQEVFLRLRAASEAYTDWSSRDFATRAKKMKRVAQLLGTKQEELASLISREMGKPIKQSRAEIEKCAWVCNFYAEHAADFLAEEVVESDATKSSITYEPLGAVLAVMPWNFPFWQVFRFAAPTLMAGNVALLKHASDVPGCSLAIQDLFSEAGFPAGVFQSLHIRNSVVKDIIKHPVVKAVSLTGSERAGRVVATEAGSSLKKCVLELGGSDPFIVLDDADLEKTLAGAVQGRMQNAGQSCIAAKRFIVTKKISKAFIEGFVDRVKQLTVGAPLNESTDVGPLARENLRDDLHAMVTASVERGAEILCGGEPIERPGFFYEPTVIAKTKPGMEVFDEETFGPVAAVMAVKDADEAVEIANKSRFGLGSSIWTEDSQLASDLIPKIEAGSVFVNGIVKSDPRLPFGGIKSSGYGRELSVVGIREFVNVKTVWLR